jgi:alpha-2-macroglobulin
MKRLALLCVIALVWATPALAQRNEGPTFSLSSSETFTADADPYFHLNFRRLTQLDFRVYKVRDPEAFLIRLPNPHEAGSYESPVPLEKSWLERVTEWKRGRRIGVRRFFRNQVTPEYRQTRRARVERETVAQRVTLNTSTFARVPLLNPNQLVTSWREILPELGEYEFRRIPLDVDEPGIYVVEAVSGALRAYTLVMVGDAALVTKVSAGQLMAFTANRETGEPLAGCRVQTFAAQKVIAEGTTDGEGVAYLPVPTTSSQTAVTIARCGEEVAVVDPGGYYFEESARQLIGYIYTDKPIYRPGHTVNVKAVMRWRDKDVVAPFDRETIELSAVDPTEKVIYRRSLPVDEFGTVKTSFPMPGGAALGRYTLRLASGDDTQFGAFEVQEYRRPEFEVIVTPASRFVVQGGEVVASVQARYYFGQPVASGRVRYTVSRQSYFSPYRWNDDAEEGEQGYFYGSPEAEGEAQLDADGRAQIRLPSAVDTNGGDYSLRIDARVMDASSREVSGDATVNATYASFMLAADVDGYVFQPRQRITTTIRAIDYTGSARPGVTVNAVLERLLYRRGYYNPPDVEAIESATVMLGATGGTATFTLPAEPASYRIRVSAGENGRTLSAETHLWVEGEQEYFGGGGERYVELIADKRSYEPGERARLVVRGEPLAGPVLLTKEGQGITWHSVVRAVAGEPLEVPVDAADAGDIFVHLTYLRDGRVYQAERRLSVPAVGGTLQVTIEPDADVARPQQPATFTISVNDRAGMPVRASVSLGVIDEAVYAIAPDQTPDPVRFFYRREYSRVSTTSSSNYYFTGYAGTDLMPLARRRRRPFSLADFKGDPEGRPQVRKDFPDAIYWIADIVTDTNGKARVSLKYPDALTTWRLTARAVTKDTLLGSRIARTMTTKDLIVRIIAPRFLTEGDRVTVPTVVHNYRPESRATSIAFEATGLQPAAPLNPVTAAIGGKGERRDDWRLTAPAAGTATVTAAAKNETDSDAVELPIPILPYGLRREVSSSGSLLAPGEARATVTIPSTAAASGRAVRVSLAPSLAGTMLGALDYLATYPYGCTEQTVSSFVPNLLVSRALIDLKLSPTERTQQVDRNVRGGLQRLIEFQQGDGGWGWWQSDATHPFMTAYAMNALVETRAAGYAVDEERFARGTRRLAELYASYPRMELALKTYVAYVLGRAEGQGSEGQRSGGQQGASRSRRDELWSRRDDMTPYARALLLLSLDEAKDARGNELAPRVVADATTTGELSYWKSDSDPLMFDFVDTSVEATATAVRALARRDPRNPVLDRAVRWLMLNRTGGYWYSTKQTAMALHGLLELLRARTERPDTFTADVYVNDVLAGTRTFTPTAMTDPDPIIVTASAPAGASNIRIVKRGGGSLYWSATAAYYDPEAAEARTGSRQLAVNRSYSRLTTAKRPNGTLYYREQPLSGPIEPGDVLRVRLTIAGSKDWRYLVLEDPLPAGVEAVQDSSSYDFGDVRYDWYGGPRVEFRDSRTVFFQQDMTSGRYEFSYLVKAISSGDFRAAPAQIAPMYVPGVNASSTPQLLSVATPGDPAR